MNRREFIKSLLAAGVSTAVAPRFAEAMPESMFDIAANGDLDYMSVDDVGNGWYRVTQVFKRNSPGTSLSFGGRGLHIGLPSGMPDPMGGVTHHSVPDAAWDEHPQECYVWNASLTAEPMTFSCYIKPVTARHITVNGTDIHMPKGGDR